MKHCPGHADLQTMTTKSSAVRDHHNNSMLPDGNPLNHLPRAARSIPVVILQHAGGVAQSGQTKTVEHQPHPTTGYMHPFIHM